MNFAGELENIWERILDDDFLDRIFDDSLSSKMSNQAIISEQIYIKAKEYLLRILPSSQRSTLQQAEDIALEISKWLMRFGFEKGLYIDFGRFYSAKFPQKSFRLLVFEQVMQMPNMQYYPEYYSQRRSLLSLFESLQKAANSDAARQISEVETS